MPVLEILIRKKKEILIRVIWGTIEHDTNDQVIVL